MKLKNMDGKSLLDKVRSEKLKLICFGAAGQLAEACDIFSDYGFFDCIYKVVDNNPKTFSWKDKNINVLLPADVFEQDFRNEFIVYISSLYYPEIYEQLEKNDRLSDMECYVHNFVVHMPLPYNFNQCQYSEEAIIPKKIHYCWFGEKEIPPQNQIWMESWSKYCPDFEIIRWDESNYDVSKNEYMYSAYKEKKYAFVSDYARLDIIFEHGGIYLDNDVELVSGLEQLLHNEAFCSSNLLGPATGAGVGAVSKSQIIAELRDYYNNISFYNQDGTLNQADNLQHQIKVLKSYGYKGKNYPQLINGLMIYPTDVLCPLDIWGNRLAYTQNTVSIHHFDASWFGVREADKRNKKLHLYKAFWDKHSLSERSFES